MRSPYGKAFLAVRDNEIAAEAMGINTTKFKVTAFVIAAFFAGIAGGLFAHYITYIKPDMFTFLKSIEIVVMVILGGMGGTGRRGVCRYRVEQVMPELLRGGVSHGDLRARARHPDADSPTGDFRRQCEVDEIWRKIQRSQTSEMTQPLLELRDCTIRFGGLTTMSISRNYRRAYRVDRPERCRQNDGIQTSSPANISPPAWRQCCSKGKSIAHIIRLTPITKARHCPHVPEHPFVRTLPAIDNVLSCLQQEFAPRLFSAIAHTPAGRRTTGA